MQEALRQNKHWTWIWSASKWAIAWVNYQGCWNAQIVCWKDNIGAPKYSWWQQEIFSDGAHDDLGAYIYIVTITKYLRCEYYKSALFLLSYNIILKYQACWFQREFKNQIGCPGSKITPACVQIPGFISCKYIDVVF